MPKSLLCLERTCGRSDCEIVSYSEFFLYDFTKGNRRAARGPGLLPARHRLPAFRNFAGHPPPHMVYLISGRRCFPWTRRQTSCTTANHRPMTQSAKDVYNVSGMSLSQGASGGPLFRHFGNESIIVLGILSAGSSSREQFCKVSNILSGLNVSFM